MPFQLPGFPGTFYEPRERKPNVATIIWRGRKPDGAWTEVVTGKTNHAAAQGIVRRYLEQLHRDTPPAAGATVTLEEAARHYKAKRSPGPDEEKRIDRIVARDGKLVVREIGQAHVTAAAHAYRDARIEARLTEKQRRPVPSTDTLNREVVTPYRALLHFAHGQGWCEWRVIEALRAPPTEVPRPPPRIATDSGVEALLRAAQGAVVAADARKYAQHEKRATRALYALVLLVHERGYRIAEWLRLRWEWLDLQAGAGQVLITKPKPRWEQFDMSPEAIAALAELQPRAEGRVFPWVYATSVYHRTDDLGVHWRPHESRRAVVTAILRATGDVKQAGAYVGHGSIKTTLRYRVVDGAETSFTIRRRSGTTGQ